MTSTEIAAGYEYWLRIVTLIHHGGKEVCLSVIYDTEGMPKDPSQLYIVLDKNRRLFDLLMKKHILHREQYNCIFPPNGRTILTNLDISALTLLLDVIFPKKYTAMIAGLRNWRNKMFHKADTEMTKIDFDKCWVEFCDFLRIYRFDTATVADLKHCALDRDSQFRSSVLEVKVEAQAEHLKSINENVQSVIEEVYALKEAQNNRDEVQHHEVVRQNPQITHNHHYNAPVLQLNSVDGSFINSLLGDNRIPIASNHSIAPHGMGAENNSGSEGQ